ncbi:hypothetical protein EZV76_12875 [Flagellimonas alvinocaridis]|uniref:Uncharacterized protein n=1 Tax=Flagellimonas alvinocaridis TaxID=2530200 RepID=A0A4S8RID9_9FLAO|nr:hypothetical protein [Allomuricauda alvinocaridis]THV58167.1 hypothetical protein EZV76_12875 [Allomuricauda alvinocaridis]
MVDKKSDQEKIHVEAAPTSKRKLEIELQRKEIQKIDAEIKSHRYNQWIEFIKIGIMVFGGGVLFLAIQQPDSFAGRRSSDEAIARERAQLVLELLKEPDPEKIDLGLTVIKSAYPGRDEKWIGEIQSIYADKANLKKIVDYKERFQEHLEDRDDLIASFAKEISRKRVDSLKVAGIQGEIEHIEGELNAINRGLGSLGASHVFFEPFRP